jgi:hypothetical protein
MSTPNNKFWRQSEQNDLRAVHLVGLGKKERPFDVELPVEV